MQAVARAGEAWSASANVGATDLERVDLNDGIRWNWGELTAPSLTSMGAIWGEQLASQHLPMPTDFNAMQDETLWRRFDFGRECRHQFSGLKFARKVDIVNPAWSNKIFIWCSCVFIIRSSIARARASSPISRFEAVPVYRCACAEYHSPSSEPKIRAVLARSRGRASVLDPVRAHACFIRSGFTGRGCWRGRVQTYDLIRSWLMSLISHLKCHESGELENLEWKNPLQNNTTLLKQKENDKQHKSVRRGNGRGPFKIVSIRRKLYEHNITHSYTHWHEQYALTHASSNNS